MKIKLRKLKEYEAKLLKVHAGVRYWEDSQVNGIEDTDGKLIPCRNGEYWEPVIYIETGQIINWQIGTTAELHYKVCDDGIYILTDADGVEIETLDSYVITCLSPKENGYGDYIIMNIDENGFIEDWDSEQCIKSFQDYEEE